MSIEGVDYSSTPNTNWRGLAAALKNTGKHFVGRYAVTDKSPNGRGITRDEYETMTANGIEVFLYWEAQTSWMLGGYDAGVNAARNALANIRAAGMPETMPVYYSHDIEPERQHNDEVDACLRGAASVVGINAVGLYGGYDIIEHVAESGTAPWLCQTYAWSRGLLHPASHLYQYNNYGNEIAGVDVDLVKALKPEYGQASSFLKPKYPETRVPAPDEMSSFGFRLVRNDRPRFVCTQGGKFKTYPNPDAPDATKSPYQAGKVYTFDYRTAPPDDIWLVSKAGSWAPSQNFKRVTA